MSKIAVVYWSGTGNTQAMAEAVAEGVQKAGAQALLLPVSETDAASVLACDAVAFGCPAMGAEVLEESEFEPFFEQAEAGLSGKKTALFGSYGWGDGQWMRDWADRVAADGGILVSEPVTANEAPDDDALEACRALGGRLAGV